MNFFIRGAMHIWLGTRLHELLQRRQCKPGWLGGVGVAGGTAGPPLVPQFVKFALWLVFGQDFLWAKYMCMCTSSQYNKYSSNPINYSCNVEWWEWTCTTCKKNYVLTVLHSLTTNKLMEKGECFHAQSPHRARPSIIFEIMEQTEEDQFSMPAFQPSKQRKGFVSQREKPTLPRQLSLVFVIFFFLFWGRGGRGGGFAS